MPPSTLLDRILWTQLARVLHGSPPEWEAESPSARVIRAVLWETSLDLDESAIVARWDADREGSRTLFDKLLQARVNRAVREGMRVEAEELGLEELPRAPKVLIVREGAPEDERPGTVERVNPKRTVVEFLTSGSGDVAELAPGAKLDQLVDLLVLANEEAADELRSSMGASVSVVRAEAEPEIDLLLAAPTPSIQVFDIERDLSRLEEVLRNAIPSERRPAKTGTWSFGKDLTGESLGGKYRIKTLKGKGAFKTVYEGEDEMLGARVAVAVLNPKGARSPRALEHFQDEAKKLTTLDHENIVRWITFDRTADGLNYFVMEYLDGEELEELLRREGRLAPKRVARILLQVVAALKRAHKAGKQGSLLHLDLKPENVFVLPALAPGEPERVKVIDFGIGQHVGAEIRAAERPELRSLYDLPAEELGKSIGSIVLPEDESAELVEEPEGGEEDGKGKAARLGTVQRRVQRARGGTLLYASPEQCKHLAGHKDIAALDGRSDLYSLGVMAFRMLTGQYPFVRNATAFEAIENHMKAPPRKVGSVGIKVPRDLAAFVDRCLVKEREKRWQDAGEAYAALERIVHPRISPLKVALPIAALALVVLGAIWWGRDPIVNPLAVVDPAVTGVGERVVEELYLGPKSPSRRLGLESDVAWAAGAPVRLLEAAGGGELAGWSVRWAEDAADTIEIERLDGAKSGAALLELDGGRRERWRSGRLTLHHLGPWRIENAAVTGHEPTRLLDPRGRAFALELGGDSEGRTALSSIEVFSQVVGKPGETSLGRVDPSRSTARDELALYPGPGLDALYDGAEHEVRLRVVARDRAGQEEQKELTLRIAGEPVALTTGTGFVVRAEPGAPLLQYSGDPQVLLPGNALALATTAPGRARVYLEPATEPALVRDVRDPAVAEVVTLEELGIAGKEELRGRLRIELDDEPWVDRANIERDTRELAFLFTPESPPIEAFLLAPGFEQRSLSAFEDGAAADSVNAAASARLVVRPPPGTPLWIEAAFAREPAEPAEAERMSLTSSGAFERALALEGEGHYRVTVQKYVLLGGGVRGPMLPPEHEFRLEVDRTAPAIAFELEGGEKGEGGEPLFRGEFSQRIVASVSESAGLSELTWSLVLPDGTRKAGSLEPAASVELRGLAAHQEADGRYALECVARDRAGNSSSKSVIWQVARGGPALSLEAPDTGADRRWILGSGSGWNVQVRASDPNGVAAVRARVVYQGRPGPELALVQASDSLWELAEADRQRAYFWWTGKELAIELVARDGAGLERRETRLGIVPELARAGEIVIRPRTEAAEIMVEHTVDGSYVFGGRAGEGRRPWNVEVTDLPSFYLDAREVTAGEMLEFVRAAGGYAERRWWPAGASPNVERRALLESLLAGEPDRAATGIAWPEAFAYAASRGKRLPTLVEWEFAVRGNEYRDGPADGAPAGAPPSWPANLCAGAREWTATPESLIAEALDFASQCRRHPERLLASAQSAAASAHWIAGPLAGQNLTWSAKDVCADASGRDDVGFRCALDRDTAHSLLDQGEYVLVE